jgi:hypothetical protein
VGVLKENLIELDQCIEKQTKKLIKRNS